MKIRNPATGSPVWLVRRVPCEFLGHVGERDGQHVAFPDMPEAVPVDRDSVSLVDPRSEGRSC